MNKRIQKFLSIIVLGSFIFSQGGIIPETFAKSGEKKSEKHFSLVDKYKGKQLERVKKGFEGKNTYKILIQSPKTLNEIKAEYFQLDKKTSVKEVSEGVFQIRFPKSSSAFSSFGSDVDSGSIPASFGGEPVIEPEVFQSFDSNYLQGENLNALWAVQKVGADSFQESLSSLPKTSVAILDTGIDMTHPDLTNNIDTGLSYDFINESSSVIDDNGHGTQVAGIIGAQVNGSGIFGVDSNTNLVSLKVLDTDGLGTSYDFLEALHYAVNHNIKIVNVSFGGAGDPTTSPVCQAISDAKSKGIFTVVAAGNTNTDVSQIIPAGCSDTITVGAYDKAGNKAAFSNYGTGVDVYAPGVDMYTTERDGSYTTKEGTSFSAPIVSGLIAKELTFSSGATYDEVLSHLKTNYSLVSSYSSVDTGNSSSGSTTGTGNMAGNSDIVGTGSITGTGGSTGVTPIDYSSYKYYSGTFLQDGKKYGNSLYSPDMNFRAENLTGVNVYTYDEYKALLKTQKKEFSAMSVPTDGLVGKWELNGNTNDTSGNGNNGTLLGTGNDFSSDSTYGAVYTPNGTDNYMVAPDSLDLKSSSSFSYGLWYNSGTKSGHKFLISKHNSDEDMDYELQITDTGHVRALINDGTLRILDSTDIPSSGVWHHLFVTFTNGVFTLYIDGIANNSLSNVGALRSSNSPFTLGVRGPSSGAYYADGKFHDVLVYNRSLSASEVQNLYESSLPVVTNSLTSGLVGKWDLNGNANDTSGNGNNGTAYNVTWVDSGRGDGKQVASFNGVNSFISAGNLGIDGGPATLSIRVKFNSLSTTQHVISQRNSNSIAGYGIFYEGGGIDFLRNRCNVVSDIAYQPLQVSTDEYYTYTLVYDGVNITGYINGTRVGQAKYSVGNGAISTLEGFNIGRDVESQVFYFNGLASDVQVYNRPLSSLEVAQLYKNSLNLPTNTRGDGLVGKWELNGNANDTSGNGNNGTLLGTGNDFSSDSTYGAVYTPNGTDNYMIAPDSLDLKSSSSFSYGLWYNSGTKGGHKFLISKHNSDEDMDYELQITDTGHVRALINDGTLRILDSTDIPSSGVWHHLFVTFTNGIFTLYIDGVANNSLSNIGALRSSNSLFTLGVRGPSSGAYYADGKFHNVLVYNRSLSASEVQNLYESSLPVVTNSLTSGLVGKWDLNGNANDTSGNGNNGTPVNVTWVDSGRGDGKQVASFDGVNSFISLAKDANTYLYNDFSISAYAKLTGDNSRPRIIYQMGNSGLGYGYYHWYSYQDFFFPDPNTPYDNEFHLYTIVKSSVDGIKLYRDGVLVVSNSDTSGVNPGYPNVNIGHFGYPGDSYFSGLLSDIRIYNRVLSASEVQKLYQDTQGTSSLTLNNQTSANTNTPSNTDRIFLNPTYEYACTESSSAPSVSNAVIKQADDTSTADSGSLGDPVNLATGEFTYENTLMSIPGNGLPFQFDIHYKNQVFYNGPLGVNWDHNYNIYLSEEANGNILFYNGKLGIYRFLKSGDTFEYNEGLKATLQNIGGNYVLTYDSGLQYFFNSDKKVAKIQDRYNNALLFTYTNGLLTTVTDTLGRTISYTYYDHNRLKDVTDFNGKKVSFTYYDGTETTGGQYDLKSIMIDQGDNHTKTISFEYTTGGDDTSNHNLTKLIDSKGQTYVTNVYDVNDRVASQTYGDGTIYYDYTLDSGLVSKNTVTDKEGNVVDYFYNANGNNTETVYHKSSGSITYQYTYNAIGYMTSEKKPNGNGTKFSYDTRGNLTEKREKADINSFDTSADIVTTYTYNARNQVLTETLDTGVSTAFTYDTDGNLTQKVISGLKTSTGATYETSQHFTYGANGLPLTSTDESGKVTSYSYTTGLVSGIVDDVGGLGLTKAITYDTYGQPLSQTDAKGKVVNFTLSPFEQILSTTTPTGIVTHTEYDANNNKTKETIDLGGGKTKEVNYTYNLLDKVTAITEEYNDGTTVTTHIIYDKNGNIIKKYTGDGAPTEYSYDHLGHLTQEKIVPNASDNSQDIVTNYAYDANGNLISKTDPQGNATTYAYDGFDRLITQTDSLGNTTEWTYFTDNTIHTIIAKDSSGNALAKTEFVTDGRGKTLKKITYKNPTGNETVEESVDYNALGQPIRSVDKKGNITTTAYDTLGRVVSTTDSLGNSVHQTYDANGNILTKTITPSTGTGVLTTTYAYDDDNRLVSQTNQLGKTQTYTYNALGNILTKTDENGVKTEYTYDYRGKVLSETKDPESSSGGQVTVYTYDERGNMTSVTDPKGNTTIYTYNNLNELTKQTYQDGKEVVYTYDKAGNVITKTDPNGNIITHTYDALNRLVSKNISPGTGILGVTSESYTYDQLGRLVQANDSNNHTLTFNYDSLNRLTQESQSGADVSYTYDDNNNLMSITSPEGKTTNYSYDELNRITNISQSGSSIATYNYAGIFNTDIQYGNSTHITKSYDALNRLSGLHNGLKDYSYTYDDVSNITSDNYKNYAYDNMYRLTQVHETSSGTNLESFSYDAVGNRTNSNTSPQSSPSQGEEAKSYTTNNLNQYTSLSGTTSESFSYDDNGNLKQNGKYNFSYDYKNRLVQVTDLSGSGIVAEFSYDVLGRRYEKKTSTETVQYVYSNENVLSEYKTINGVTLKKDYINGIGTDNLVAVEQEENSLTQVEKEELNFCSTNVLTNTGGFIKYGWQSIVDRCNQLTTSGSVIVENRYYFSKDQLGSVVGIMDNSGSLVTRYDYDSYGNATESGSDIGNTRLYSGREYDKEINLYYLRARYYSSELGRFISRDPIDIADNINLYSYVGGNPVNAVDLSGLSKNAIIKLFRQSGEEIDAYLYFNDTPLLNNDYEYFDLNMHYFDMEYKGTITYKGITLKGVGRYDLAMGGYQISNRYDRDGNGNVEFDGEQLSLGEISNVLAGLNGYRMGFSKDHLEKYAMRTVEAGAGNGIDGELADRKLYDFGYKLGELEKKNGKLTDEEIIKYVKEGINARKNYINNK